MKITIEKSVLAKALSHMHRVVERRNTIPILSNVLLMTETGELKLRATDLDIEVSESIPATVETQGAITVPAHLFHEIVRKLPDDATILMDATGENTLILTSGRAKFSLQILPAADFPDLSQGEMSHRFEIAKVDLKSLVEKTDFAISTEETRYYLTGIFFHTVEEDTQLKLRTVATDGHRLALTEVDAPEGTEGMPSVIVPRKAIAELKRLMEDAPDVLTVGLSESKIEVIGGKMRLISKLIDGTFPDYKRVIPYDNALKAKMNRAKYAQAVDLVSTMSADRGRAVKCNFSKNALVLTVTNPDSGLATLDVEIAYDADPMEIGFNAKYLLDIAGEIKSEELEMALSDSGSPALFRASDDSPTLYVLMPMRV